jgi:tetratricopeptide (TPR) repeat protein
MSNETAPVRISAFVSRSFLKEDEVPWFEIRKLFESLRPLGFVFEDAKEAQLRPVSEKVRQGIERNDFLIGILGRRLPIGNQPAEPSLFKRILAAFPSSVIPSNWTTSNWVIQETGFALGRGKKVLLLIEKGVDFPFADLDADTEWISFDRSNLPEIYTRLVSMISNLISEKLPTLPPTIQVSPPEEIPPVEDRPQQPRAEDHLNQTLRLLNQRDFENADNEFEKFVTVIKVDGSESDELKWRYIYLRFKATRGHTASFHELENLVETQPDNVDTRIQLSHYFRDFKDYGQAAQILIDGAENANMESKPKMIREAAENLTKNNQLDKALRILRDLIPRLADPTQLRMTYLSIADVAKSQSDRDLESAALERVLDLDPSDTQVRFRLAYLYGEMQKPNLAAYHYQLHIEGDQEQVALNNLGIAYGQLKLPGKEIESFEKADEEWLAKANLSHAYIDRGFLMEAEKLATQVTKADCDEIALKRAVGALSRISTMRSTENETEEKALLIAQRERTFRSAYAEAIASQVSTLIEGEFETPYGRITFKHQGTQLLGEGMFEEQTFGGLFSRLAGGTSTDTIVKTVKFEANIDGRSGRFRVETQEKNKAPLLGSPKSTTSKGLLITAIDGESFEILEEHETEAKLHKANKVSS